MSSNCKTSVFEYLHNIIEIMRAKLMLYIISAILKYIQSLKYYTNISIFCYNSFKLTAVRNWGDWSVAELYWSNFKMRICLLLVWFVWFLSTFAFLCSWINHMRKITPFTLKCRSLRGDSIGTPISTDCCKIPLIPYVLVFVLSSLCNLSDLV